MRVKMLQRVLRVFEGMVPNIPIGSFYLKTT